MNKEFDRWNTIKKRLEITKGSIFMYPGEIWWCSIGINVGTETDGKNENFERPVLIMKVYNKTSVLVLPLTGQIKIDKFHFCLEKVGKTEHSSVKLTQAKTISTKRLVRKIRRLPENEFQRVLEAFKASL